ncbi:type II secretion system protein J [Acidovorax sp. Root402]|uniref:PulJ/GspJ family protein n=1 Tax=Acidovorax sp. Root402 TaxID=1736527 RepID=UPI000A55D27A|nr:prepilin-type N-terminal cleavage/methylation domain-containing protein [Acidovorax sp. Root402]
MEHPPEALRAFPPLSHCCAMRAGGRRQRGGAALARRPLARAAPVAQAPRRRLSSGGTAPLGFTLIELLVAISVMALIAILSWRGLDGMVRAQESTRQRADEMLVLQAALGQWGTDLDALMPVANTTPLDWDGQVLRLTRRSSAVPDEGALVVAWTRRNNNQGVGQWLRWQSPPVRTRDDWRQAWEQAAQWARTPGDAERRYEVTLLPLDSWQIFYYRGGAWSNPQSSTGTPSGDSTSAIPDGIRLQITLPPGQALAGQLTRDWVNPALGGGRT